MQTVWQDVRYALRTLTKNPGFSLVAILTLAVGIGCNAAVFSLVNSVLLRPLQYSQPDQLVRITGFYPKGAVLAMQRLSRTMEIASYTADSEFNISGRGEAIRVAGSAVSANLFSVLGAQAAIGRAFHSGDDQLGRDSVVLLSHALWQNKFDSDPGIVGRVIRVNGQPREVLGVMPAGFAFVAAKPQVWVPLHLDASNAGDFWGAGYMPLVARLHSGASIPVAREELRSLVPQVLPLFPFSMAREWNSDATVLPLQDDLVGDVRAKLFILLSAVGLVLLVASANVSGLMLTRAAARRKEIALRTALGAAPARLVRQFLTESVVLSIAGGTLGLFCAYGTLSALKILLPADTPRLNEVAMDWRVLVFMGVLVFIVGFAAGLAPALSGSRLNLATAIRTSGQKASCVSGARLRNSFIAAEVALAVILVVGAGLLVKSLWLLLRVSPGFQTQNALTMRVTPDPSLCKERSACVALYDDLLQRAQATPGVSQAALVNALPLSGEKPAVPVELEDHTINPAENLAPLFWAGAVTPDYFAAMRIPTMQGRGFSTEDAASTSKVVMVSAATARRYWPGQNAVGKHVKITWDSEWRTVVGVVGDVRLYDLANNIPDSITGTLYMPYAQSVGLDRQLPTAMTIVLRSSANAQQIGTAVRALVNQMNPNIPVGVVQTMNRVVSDSVAPARSMMWLFAGFGGLALLLALIGVYGVVSFSAAQRTYELGVRVALGATKSNIMALVLGQSLRLVSFGLAIGVFAALLASRALSKFLFGVNPGDPSTILAVCVLLMFTALLAGYLPARRAARIDPVTALRVD
jgi:predicted permease